MDKKQVFVLEIMDNQKNTWQGQLRWIQGQKESSFRSVLELLHLVDSAINRGNAQEAESEEAENLWERQ